MSQKVYLGPGSFFMLCRNFCKISSPIIYVLYNENITGASLKDSETVFPREEYTGLPKGLYPLSNFGALQSAIEWADSVASHAPIHVKHRHSSVPVSHTNRRSIKNTIDMVMNCIVSMGLKVTNVRSE